MEGLGIEEIYSFKWQELMFFK